MKAKKLLFIAGFFFIALVVSSLVSSFFAWDPADLLVEKEDGPPPIAIQVAEAKPQEAPPEPPPQKEASLLATLAPD